MLSLRSVARAPKTVWTAIRNHGPFVGPGLIASVAYFDPGNWAVDLQAGSQYGYALLVVILVAGLAAIVLQVQATRLGIVTGLDLARHTRLLLHNRPKHRRFFNVILYIIYGLVEIAIIATDLAELLGSAIALNLLFPKIPLYAGVLLTAADTLLVLAFFQRTDSTSRKGTMAFEIIISILVFSVFGCFAVLVARIDADWGLAFRGYLPSKTNFSPGALYISIGIIGATTMPHALFIGSRLATVDRLDLLPPEEETPLVSSADASAEEQQKRWRLPSRNILDVFPPSWRSRLSQNVVFRSRSARRARADDKRAEGQELELPQLSPAHDAKSKLDDAQLSLESPPLPVVGASSSSSVFDAEVPAEDKGEFNRLAFVKAHIQHAQADIIISLASLAIPINSAILIIAAAALYYRSGSDAVDASEADLFDAHRLIGEFVGQSAATLFAVALLCAGLSASISATLAGQVVSEGFIEWKTSPLVRRLVTRLISMVPAITVAVAVGKDGIDTLLVASQVALSIVLPFAIFPLIYLTSSSVMVITPPRDPASASVVDLPAPSPPTASSGPDGDLEICAAPLPTATPAVDPDAVSFKSSKGIAAIGWFIFTVIVVANSYVIVVLAMGKA